MRLQEVLQEHAYPIVVGGECAGGRIGLNEGNPMKYVCCGHHVLSDRAFGPLIHSWLSPQLANAGAV